MGGAGNDNIFAGVKPVGTTPKGDSLVGGAGNDTIVGGTANDIIFGADPNDPAAPGNDSILGGDGDDVVTGGAGDDTVLGEAAGAHRRRGRQRPDVRRDQPGTSPTPTWTKEDTLMRSAGTTRWSAAAGTRSSSAARAWTPWSSRPTPTSS